jgi:hypothetical protein
VDMGRGGETGLQNCAVQHTLGNASTPLDHPRSCLEQPHNPTTRRDARTTQTTLQHTPHPRRPSKSKTPCYLTTLPHLHSMALPCQSSLGRRCMRLCGVYVRMYGRVPKGDESSTISPILRITKTSSLSLRVHAASRRATKQTYRALQYGLPHQLMHDAAAAAVKCP